LALDLLFGNFKQRFAFARVFYREGGGVSMEDPQGGAARVGHVQEQQRDVLVHVQGAVARPVPPAAGPVERLQKAREDLEVFDPRRSGPLIFLRFSRMMALTQNAISSPAKNRQ